MARIVSIHGAADAGWSWPLVEAERPRQGHEAVAPELTAAAAAAAAAGFRRRW